MSTQTKSSRAPSEQLAMSVVKVRRSALRRTSSARPGSWIVTSPRESESTFSWQDVAGDDRVAELGEAGRGHQTHPTDSDHSYRLSLLARHFLPPCFGFLLGMITSADRAIPTI